jgi:hypothetical protein
LQLQQFSPHAVFEIHEACSVATWVREGLDVAGADRIRALCKHDRHCAGQLQQRRYRRAAGGQDNLRCERDQLGRVSAIAIGIARAPAQVDAHIAAFGPAELLQALLERRDPSLPFWIVCGGAHECADTPHSLRLLRARRQRPNNRTTECTETFASSHVLYRLRNRG